MHQDLLNFIKNKSSSLVRTPEDMLHFSCLQSTISPGLIKYFSEEEKNKSSKDWQPDFSYYINDIGFRGEYPSIDDLRLLGFFGCSVTFGQGVPEDKIYANLISQHYNKKYLNFGIPGASCHRIALTFSAAVRLWNIETAVINLPPYSRLHYVDTDDRLQSILLANKLDQPELEYIRKEILKNVSEQFLISQTIDSIQWIIDIAKLKNINLILASWDDDTMKIINTAFELNAIKFNFVDKARDGHPGIKSHEMFATDIINILANGTYIS